MLKAPRLNSNPNKLNIKLNIMSQLLCLKLEYKILF